MERRALGPVPLLLAALALLAVACVRVEIQRTTTAEPEQTVPTPVRRATVSTPPAEPVAPPRRAAPATGSASRALFRLRMPPATAIAIARLGIDVPVVDVASVKDERGWHWPVPHDAAAHLIGTANPGEPGNIAITGHVDTERGAGVFWRLLEVRPGDEVTVWSAAGTFVYRVSEVLVVPESDRSVLRQTREEVLTLLTCLPDGRYDKRLVVRAEPVRPAVARQD